MAESNLIYCQNRHVFSKKRHGTVCPYCNVETATKEQKEVQRWEPYMEEELPGKEIKPVCGWIVCIDGPQQGKDYQIIQGKNFIGRADDMDIQVSDKHISLRNHAVLVFDPQKKETVLLPGESRGIVCLNSNVVCGPTVLNPYDEMVLGKSRFLFIPFCGDRFMWGEKTE